MLHFIHTLHKKQHLFYVSMASLSLCCSHSIWHGFMPIWASEGKRHRHAHLGICIKFVHVVDLIGSSSFGLDTSTHSFFCLGKFLQWLADDQFSSITKGSIYYVKHMYTQPFSMEVDWQEIWHQMDVSTTCMCYICRYCIFTLWGRCAIVHFTLSIHVHYTVCLKRQYRVENLRYLNNDTI